MTAIESNFRPSFQPNFRHRHDGWTPARQNAFLAALRASGCVRTACDHVGLSSTSAYRAKRRIAAFSESWDLMLHYRAPALEAAAYERAVHGWLEPVLYKGEVVAHRRRYSDAMLRLLLQREAAKQGPGAIVDVMPRRATQAETDAALTKKLDALAAKMERERRAEALAYADRMTAAGWAP